MRIPRRIIAAILGPGLVTGLALATAPSRPAAASSPATLRVVADTSVATFNPFLAYFNTELDVLGNIYPTLTRFDSRGELAPYLATSWTTSADHLTWTFTIRSGLKWSDGVPITASDAAWTLNLIVSNPTAATANGSLVANFAKVSAPNPTTLVITTKKPEANMLYVSTPIAGIPIVPRHIWASQVAHLGTFKNMNFPVVGYGPWTLTGYVPNQYTTLTANKNFFLGAPKFDKLLIEYFTNTDAAVAALRSGQLDEIDNVTATEYQALHGERNMQLAPSVSSGWTSIELNPGAKYRNGKPFGNGNPVLADPRVREAIALAINRNMLVQKIWNGLAVPGAGYLPPGYPQWWWKPPAAATFGYDPGKANQVLNQAGYKMGSGGVRVDPKTGKPLVLRFGIHSDESTDAELAPYIVEWLQAIGIKVVVQAMSFSELNAVLPKGTWDMLSDAWTTGPDPTYLLSIQDCGTLPLPNGTGGNTDAFFCDPAYDNLFSQQVGEFDTAQRAATVDQMQQILYNANVDIMLWYADNLSVARTDHVKNYFSGAPDARGLYPHQDLFLSWSLATPVTDSGGASSPAVLIVVIIVVVVLAGLGTVYGLRRRVSADERE